MQGYILHPPPETPALREVSIKGPAYLCLLDHFALFSHNPVVKSLSTSIAKSPAGVAYGAATPFSSLDEAKRIYDVLGKYQEVKEIDTARVLVSIQDDVCTKKLF